MTGLSMAISMLHMPDVLALKAQLLSDGKTQEEIDLLPLTYFKKKCVSDFHLCATQLVCSNWPAICILLFMFSLLSCVSKSA